MRYLAPALTTSLFFIWILPLGIFIKPSQEKTACNGQRAICLCSHLLAKQAAGDAGKTIYRAGGSVEQREQNSSAGSGNYFLFAHKENRVNKQLSFHHRQQFPLYSLLAVRLIEHVPKRNFLS